MKRDEKEGSALAAFTCVHLWLKMSLALRFAILFGLLLGLVSCEKSAPKPVAVPRVEIGTGIMRGKVLFEGGAVAIEPASGMCGDHQISVPNESLEIGKSGGVKNTFVCIVGVSAGDGAKREPAVLDQKGCVYTPHAVAVQVGQTLKIRSSDATLHNVHFQPQRNEARNFAMTTAGAEQEVTFKNSEIIRVRCDVHPWMSATIGVFDNPFFAVTDEDGQFELTGLPEGTYTLSTWHERLGELTQEVTIGNEASNLTLTYKAN
jgi:plastocyanin